VGESLAARFGDQEYALRCREQRAQAIVSFRRRFWYEAGGYLFDVVDGDDGDDPSLRPNQIFAAAFPDLLEADRAERVVQVVEERLLTPVGLRTLAPDDPQYKPRYEGDVIGRDGAYHQGTVWPFLLGPFVTAWVRVRGGIRGARREARGFFEGLERHLGEACLAQVSEIFDADPPHRPRGCPAQAWSVAEPLRTLLEDVQGKGPDGGGLARWSEKESRRPPAGNEESGRQRAA
jgi:glycogen debranching enzyme